MMVFSHFRYWQAVEWRVDRVGESTFKARFGQTRREIPIATGLMTVHVVLCNRALLPNNLNHSKLGCLPNQPRLQSLAKGSYSTSGHARSLLHRTYSIYSVSYTRSTPLVRDITTDSAASLGDCIPTRSVRGLRFNVGCCTRRCYRHSSAPE